tara:strand:+ start:89 stop:481 length:393 start_codon:yes stop_codon:yes gene_type:complete
MNEEKQNILQNFLNLEEELLDSPSKEKFSILREAWAIEIDKPGCSQCIKNAAQNKYSQIAHNMLEHDLSIEDSKVIHDKRTELNKEHQIIQERINNQIDNEIKTLKGTNKDSVLKQESQSNSAFNPFLNQ